MRNPKNKCLTFVILFITISIFASITLFANIEKTPFHGDESGWISSGYYFTDLLLKGNFQRQKWECPQCSAWGSSLNPHLGQWAIGIYLKAIAPQEEETFFKFYDFKASLEENEKEGKIPPRPILLHARSISAVFGVLCVLLMFVIGYYSNNLWVGGIAAILLLFNQLFIGLCTQAMTDVYYNFFLLCGCLAGIYLHERSRVRDILFASCAYGCLAGLASSVKITGLLIGALHFALIILCKKITCKLEMKNAIRYLAVFSISALVIIYLLNPYFWLSFREMNGGEIVEEVKAFYQDAKEGKIQKENIQNIRKQYPQLINLSSILEFPYMFIRWKSFMDLQQSEFKSASWQGNRLRTFHERLFMEFSTFPLEWCFLCIGIFFYGWKTVNAFRNRQLVKSVIPFLYFMVNYVFILVLLKLNWGRYYLPTIIAGKIIVATVICEAGTLIYAKFFIRNSSLNFLKFR